MNKEFARKLMAILPDGERKQELIRKYEALNTKSEKRGEGGLQDTFEFKPKGHITIEQIDEKGRVVGVLADQPNLVVDGAEEILLRAFSGDPNRILYKNRKVKDPTGITEKIYVSEGKLGGNPLFDGNQLLHAPNLLWAEVNEEDFVTTYGYYPETVYVQEEVSTEVGKKAFSISNSPAAGRVPMSSEIYSTYTNLFIGIGEGINHPIPLTDARLVKTEDIAVQVDRAETTVEGEEISFTQKISNFEIDVESSDKGAQIDVFINGSLVETIEAYNSSLSDPVILTFKYDDLDADAETAVRLVHSGSDTAVTDAKMTIVGLRMDSLTKSDNALMSEFKNFETDFLTETAYNTTPMAPYTIQLPHFPVKENTVAITYEGNKFTEVESEADLAATTFIVDHLRGIVTFNRALTGVMTAFSSTGEIYDTELVATMTASPLSSSTTTLTPLTGQTVAGVADGTNVDFVLSHSNVTPSTVVVHVNGSSATTTGFDPATSTVTLATAPAAGDVVTADYTYETATTTTVSAQEYKLAFPATAGTVKLIGEDGVEFDEITDIANMGAGKFMIDPTDATKLILSTLKADGQPLARVETTYRSEELPGVPTGYARAVIEKPKTVNAYPWFELDKGAVQFVAEFPESTPIHNVTIREMGLFDGPRAEDKIAGFTNYPVKAFSLVRVGKTRKEASTGIRITWTITLLNSEDQPFKGGSN